MTAAVALAAAAVPLPLPAQTASRAVAVLDVPYLPQSEALCGGAAIAMVMRYWGTPAVYAETFADLVDPEARGIRGRDLIQALESRGFEAASFEGNPARIQRALAARLPPIALIEDRPGRFHYVVIVGWRDSGVVVHDPARAPYRVIAPDTFVRAWSASGFWSLIAQPRAGASSNGGRETERADRPAPLDAPPAGPAVSSPTVCSGMVDEGIRLAATGDLSAAQRVLLLAAADCSRDPAPWRELAGVHAVRGEWAEAAREARRALDRDPNDQHAVRILATSLFLEGRDAEALDAWNRTGAPVVDIVDIRGLERTRFAVAADALDLPPETLLTGDRLARARRRLNALPALMGSRVTYVPRDDDRAQVNVAVLERPLAPSGLIPLAAAGVRTAVDREVALNIASPTGGGELWSASWRWWEKRPRVALGIAAPSPFGGVWSVEMFGERQTYGGPALETSERRRGAVLRAADWISGATRIEAGAGIDRWSGGTTASMLGGLERIFASGRARASLDGALITGAHDGGMLDAASHWRSTDARAGHVWHARSRFSLATSDTPLAWWPGAGTGQGRDALLRAHPLLDDGAIRGVFGRRLVSGGVEWRYWPATILRTLRLAPALFVDSARALRVPAFGDGRTHVDAGGGLRIAVPGAGLLRIDLAHGLRDGRTALSFGWAADWDRGRGW